MKTTTVAPPPEFDGDREGRDRRFAEAIVEGCSNTEAARRAGSRANSVEALCKYARARLKSKRVQELILELGDEDGAGIEDLADLAVSTLRAVIEDKSLQGTNAHVRACDLVLRRVEKFEELQAKMRALQVPSDMAQEERRKVVLDAARSILLASPPDVRSEFFRGLDVDEFGGLISIPKRTEKPK